MDVEWRRPRYPRIRRGLGGARAEAEKILPVHADERLVLSGGRRRYGREGEKSGGLGIVVVVDAAIHQQDHIGRGLENRFIGHRLVAVETGECVFGASHFNDRLGMGMATRRHDAAVLQRQDEEHLCRALDLGCRVLGGIEIEHDRGPVGHSDGDVLIHAIVDSILGASSMGDIGQLFSSSNDKWKDADSMIFLKQTVEKVRSAGFKINHIDSVIILQQPNISSYIDSMRSNISERISVDKSQISIKATTTDYMGYIGKGEGIATQAIATLDH